jgi:hypothetical protein
MFFSTKLCSARLINSVRISALILALMAFGPAAFAQEAERI